VATPGVGTIEDVCAVLGIEPALTIKSVVVVTPRGPVMALVRGDQRLHEKKLARLLGEFRPAHRDEIVLHLGVRAGSIGPVGTTLPVVADEALREGRYVVGANKEGFHLRGVVPGLHFHPKKWADIHHAGPGDGCPRCDASLKLERVIEVGNIFKLGTRYSVPLRAVYLNESGEERPIVMGSYGIGPARIIAAAIEQHHDDLGIVWPPSIAPFQVHLLPVNMRDETTAGLAEDLYARLQEERLEVLYDDRDERAGVKFKDADLLGLPLRLTIGSRALKDGMVELKVRKTGEERRLPPAAAVSRVRELLAQPIHAA
jgi:prolyl-tRNA synthetase